MFLGRIEKNHVYPCKPQFYYIKVGFKGVKITDMFSWCEVNVTDTAWLRSLVCDKKETTKRINQGIPWWHTHCTQPFQGTEKQEESSVFSHTVTAYSDRHNSLKLLDVHQRFTNAPPFGYAHMSTTSGCINFNNYLLNVQSDLLYILIAIPIPGYDPGTTLAKSCRFRPE